MSVLLLQLIGPMQSWGTTSRFDVRETGKEPSKSGILGILAAALGIDRSNWKDLEPLTQLTMGVRHDRPGFPRIDLQTAGCAAGETMIKANGTQSHNGVLSRRHYLADAAFLVGLESPDRLPLEAILGALKNPVWPIGLGRKSYLPSEPLWGDTPLTELPLREALTTHPWLGHRHRGEPLPHQLRVSYESQDHHGQRVMDVPLSSFQDRHFGARYLTHEWIPLPHEVAHVSA